MNKNKRKYTNVRLILLSVLAGAMATGTLSYSVDAAAAQQFVLTDGVTVTSEEPVLDPHEANFGTFEGGPTGTVSDTRINLAVPEDVQRGGGGFNIPTGAPASRGIHRQPPSSRS